MKLAKEANSARKNKRKSSAKRPSSRQRPAKEPKNPKVRSKVNSKNSKRPPRELLREQCLAEPRPLVEFTQEFKEVAAAAELFNSSALPLHIYNRDAEKDSISSFLSP